MTSTKVPRGRAAAKFLTSHVPDSWMPALTRIHMRVNRDYWRTVRRWQSLLQESDSWSTDELTQYQLRRLRELLTQAYVYVPYYRGIFDGLGARPSDIRELSDLHNLPTLSKRDVQDRQPELLATNVEPRDRAYATTAGSTGIPVGFFHERAAAAQEWAFISTLWRRVGYRDGDRTAVIRGSVVEAGQLFERVPWRNTLMMSSYHLTEDRLPRYIERLRRYRPRFIQAYPSAATLLARHLIDHGERPFEGLTAVLCGSENLYEWQRVQIQQAFGCRVFSWYGQSEHVCLAGECEENDQLHIFPQYGVTELVDASGAVIETPGRLGQIVGTGFLTRAMPLIRYETMDLAVLAADSCGCGRSYDRFERIEGRLQEFVVTSTGRYISMAAINMHSPVFDNVYQFRFRQAEPGRVTLNIVPKASYRGDVDAVDVRRELEEKLGDDVDLEIALVPEIPPGPRGKFRFLDQELPVPFSDQ